MAGEEVFGGVNPGLGIHLDSSLHARLDYVFSAPLGEDGGNMQSVALSAQGRLDWLNTVPWVALGPSVHWVHGDTQWGTSLQLGVDVLVSPVFSWGGLVGQGFIFGDEVGSAVSLGLFVSGTLEASDPF